MTDPIQTAPDQSIASAIQILTEYREALAVSQWLADNDELPPGFSTPDAMAASFMRPRWKQLAALLRTIQTF